jgi:hypothetical protein
MGELATKFPVTFTSDMVSGMSIFENATSFIDVDEKTLGSFHFFSDDLQSKRAPQLHDTDEAPCRRLGHWHGGPVSDT